MGLNFQPGDQVELISGGPVMTVAEKLERIGSLPKKEDKEVYRCQWFAGKKLESGNFPVQSLKSATTDDESEQ